MLGLNCDNFGLCIPSWGSLTSNLTDLPHSLSSAHVYSSCVAWSCDWIFPRWGYTKTWKPNLSTLSRWHWSFTIFAKPKSDKSHTWRLWGQTFLDLEMFSNVHCSSDGDLHYLVGYCSWFARILGYPQLWTGPGALWKNGFEIWPAFYYFDGEHWNSWFGSHVAVPYCTNYTHPFGSTFFVPQLGGGLVDAELNRSCKRSCNSKRILTASWVSLSPNSAEALPPAMRDSWIAIPHWKSIAESLASIEPTWMQIVVRSVPADGSCQSFPICIKRLAEPDPHDRNVRPCHWRGVHLGHCGVPDASLDHLCCTDSILDLDRAGSNDAVSCGLNVAQSPEGRPATRLGCRFNIPSMLWQKHSAMHRCGHQPGNKFDDVSWSISVCFLLHPTWISLSTLRHHSPSMHQPGDQCSWHHTAVRRIRPDNKQGNTTFSSSPVLSMSLPPIPQMSWL